MINLTINGKKITAPEGSTILEAARANGIDIPTLCYDKAVEVYGACGLCVVEAEGIPKLLRSCSAKAAEGMVISLIGYTLFILMPTIGGSKLFTIHSSLFTSIGYYSSALLIGLGNGHMWPAFQNMMITMAHHNERGTANSTILISWDIGMGLGVLAGGAIAEITGYSAAFWTVAVMNAIGVALYFLKTQNFFLTRRIEEA